MNFLSSECVSSGACVQACPTAKVGHRRERRSARSSRPASCGVGCSFKAELKGDEVLRVVFLRPARPTRGHSCVKGRFAYGCATHKEPHSQADDPGADRRSVARSLLGRRDLLYRRTNSGAFRRSMAGIQLARSVPRAAPTRKCFSSSRKWLAPEFGNNNIDTCARVSSRPLASALSKTFGTSAGTQDFKSVDKTDVVVVMGANPTDAHPVWVSASRNACAPARVSLSSIPAAPIWCDTRIEADYHLALKPGTNVAVNALAHVIVTEGLIDEAFVRERCDLANFEVPGRALSPIRVIRPRPAASIRASSRGTSLRHGWQRRDLLHCCSITEHSQGSTLSDGDRQPLRDRRPEISAAKGLA